MNQKLPIWFKFKKEFVLKIQISNFRTEYNCKFCQDRFEYSWIALITSTDSVVLLALEWQTVVDIDFKC